MSGVDTLRYGRCAVDGLLGCSEWEVPTDSLSTPACFRHGAAKIDEYVLFRNAGFSAYAVTIQGQMSSGLFREHTVHYAILLQVIG